MTDDSAYVGREQSFVKHFILRKYLERFAHIVGFGWQTVTYVDCFSGPWNVRSDDLADSSFSIALEELRKAKETHRVLDPALGGKLKDIRCLFLEKAAEPYRRLERFAQGVTDAKVETLNREFVEAMPEVLDFIGRGGKESFPFIFIDPKGWTGLEMESIAPLLRVNPGEVLINFMTDFVRRFLNENKEEPKLRESVRKFFGSSNVLERVESFDDPNDREDELFSIYAENLRVSGNFKYVCAAIVLHPENDRSYFHLIYGTRHRRGVEVFKDVERKAMDIMEETRAIAQQRGRIQKTKQGELFTAEYSHRSVRIETLRGRYLETARHEVEVFLRSKKPVPYDAAYDAAMAYPLVWEADLKEWTAEWVRQGVLEIRGTQPRQKAPKLEENNLLVWK